LNIFVDKKQVPILVFPEIVPLLLRRFSLQETYAARQRKPALTISRYSGIQNGELLLVIYMAWIRMQ
jgi:hypothetical protein